MVDVEQEQAALRRLPRERFRHDLGEVPAVVRAGQRVGARAELGVGARRLELPVGVLHLRHAPAQLALEPAPLGDVAGEPVEVERAVRVPARAEAIPHDPLAAVEADEPVLELEWLPVAQARRRGGEAVAVIGVQQRVPQPVVAVAAGKRPAEQRVAVRAAVDRAIAAVVVDLQRVEMIVERLDDPRERGVRRGQLGAHAMPLRDV
jgi:hypothetical protein